MKTVQQLHVKWTNSDIFWQGLIISIFQQKQKIHSRNTLVDLMINITWLNELKTLKLLSQSDKTSLLLAAMR